MPFAHLKNFGNTNEMMHLAVEASPSGMVMMGSEGKIVMANSMTEKLFGYDRHELLGHPLEILLPERFRQKHPEYRQAYIGESTSRPMGHGKDVYGLHKNGKEFPIEVGLNPIETQYGIYVLAAIVDISDRNFAENMLRLAVEASPNGMIMSDRNGIIVMVNTTTETLFGYARNELMNHSIEMLIPQTHRRHHPQLRKNYLEQPSARAMGHGRDLFGLHKNGLEFPVEVGLNPIQTPQGQMILASVIDITERKHQEEQLKAALKEKDLLLSEIHHRVKNNLQIIDSLLGMQSDRSMNGAAIGILKESQNRVKSMAMIHQILYESTDFSRVDFSAVTESLVSNLSASYALNTSNIHIVIDADHVLLPINISIPLGLILNELCTNAMKYAFALNHQGNIDIALKYLDNHRLQVIVSDDGRGLPEELDIDNTSTLGLQLVTLLSEQISAELTIQRKNPTRFTLMVPV